MPFHRPIPGDKQPKLISSGIGALAQAENLMQIALVLPCATFIGWLAGAWADSHFHQSWIALAGIVFGGISGLVYVVRLAIAASSDPKNADKPEDDIGKGSDGPDHD
jgi:uncharacterized membrane protein YfcA